MVYLTGAGPGEYGLITVKAMDVLRKADIVVYDRLIDPLLLLETRPDCQLIDAGKSSGEHTIPQEGISKLLVEYGKTGLNVVRLKGGDPLLFGRGGEEAELLKEENIPYEIIPGVSALTAVPAYSGIPLTHRDFSSSVGVATGHGADGKKDDPVKWRTLASGVETIVVFMGVGNLGNITLELIAGGLTPETEAAIIEKGTTPLQRVYTGTLGTIVSIAETNSVKPPALLIVGKSVALHNKLSWYNPGPLAGMKIGVTRPRAQSKSFAEKLKSLGASPVLMPTIKTIETSNTPEVQYAFAEIVNFDYILFMSVNGVESFFSGLKNFGKDSRSLNGKLLGAIGPVTAQALDNYGIIPDLIAETFVAEGLLDKITTTWATSGKRFLLVRSDIGRDTLAEGLREAGAEVYQASFYSTVLEELSPIVKDMIIKGAIDMITFTSSSTVECFFDQIPPENIHKNLKLASIGPQTTASIQKRFGKPDIEAKVFTTAGLADAILDYTGKILRKT